MEGFDARKARALAELESGERDRSRKGGLDAPIASLVKDINASQDLFTTSSCSGRISLFAQRPPASGSAKERKKVRSNAV